jgi:hypothetical protein
MIKVAIALPIVCTCNSTACSTLFQATSSSLRTNQLLRSVLHTSKDMPAILVCTRAAAAAAAAAGAANPTHALLLVLKGAVACFRIVQNTGRASRPGRPFRAAMRTGLLKTTQTVRFGLQMAALRGRAAGLSQHWLPLTLNMCCC